MLPPAFHALVGMAGDLNVGDFRDGSGNGNSRWLVLSALIVTTEHLEHLEQWRDQVFAYANDPCTESLASMDHSQRMSGLLELSMKPVGVITVMSNKTTLPGDPIFEHMSQPAELFRYVARYLVERVSDVSARKAEQLENPYARASVILPRSDETDPRSLKEYLNLLARRQKEGAAYTAHGINFDHLDMDAIDDGKIIAHPGLQLAQLVADSFMTAVEPESVLPPSRTVPDDGLPDYAICLQRRLVRSARGHVLDAGIKPMPTLSRMDLNDTQRRFFQFWN